LGLAGITWYSAFVSRGEPYERTDSSASQRSIDRAALPDRSGSSSSPERIDLSRWFAVPTDEPKPSDTDTDTGVRDAPFVRVAGSFSIAADSFLCAIDTRSGRAFIIGPRHADVDWVLVDATDANVVVDSGDELLSIPRGGVHAFE
jgi:hypothetical protein